MLDKNTFQERRNLRVTILPILDGIYDISHHSGIAKSAIEKKAFIIDYEISEYEWFFKILMNGNNNQVENLCREVIAEIEKNTLHRPHFVAEITHDILLFSKDGYQDAVNEVFKKSGHL